MPRMIALERVADGPLGVDLEPAGMGYNEESLCDADDLGRLMDDLANQIVEGRQGESSLAMVGVRSRGVPLAERLAERLQKRLGVDVPVGAVEVTLYRDDLGRGDRWPVLWGTDIPFVVEGTEVILVDDVLYTGRTARAALNAVCDLGRPACIRLAVVVDRGGRELPIQADYVGLHCQADPDQRVEVRIRPIDLEDQIARVGLTSP